MNQNQKIVLSYSHKDAPWAEVLSKATIRTPRGLVFPVIDKQVLVTGDDFDQKLKQEFGSANAFVLLVSKSFLESEYIRNREWGWVQEGMKKICWIAIGGVEETDLSELDEDARKILSVLKTKEWGARLPGEPPADRDELAGHVRSFREGISEMLDPVGAGLFRKMRHRKIEELTFVADGEVACVFTARGSTLGRTLAVKVAKHRSHNDAFLAGLEMARKFEGIPNFIPMYEIDLEEQPCHCLSEFVQGRSLARLVADHNAQNRDVEPSTVHRILLKLSFALQAANRRGYPHLNIRPSNILIDKFGEPFLSPTSRLATHLKQQFCSLLDELRSDPSGLQESLAYLLPDLFLNPRWKGEAADVYLLGLIGYQLLSGEYPPTISNLEDLKAGKSSIPEFRELPEIDRPNCPVQLKLTISRMTALDVRHRYKTFSDVLHALMRYPTGSLARAERSWLACRGSSGRGFYEKFYQHFFDLAPEAKDAFPDTDATWPTRRQKNLLDSAVPQLFQYYSLWSRYRQVPDALNPLIGQARQHATRKKIRSAHFDAFGKALVKTCAECDDQIDVELGHDDETFRALTEVLRPGIEYMARAFEEFSRSEDELP